MRLTPVGDSAVVLALGETVDDAMLARVRVLARAIEHHAPRGVVDVVPAFACVTVFYEIAHTAGFPELCAELEAIAARAEAAIERTEPRVVDIPVCYGGEFGPDLDSIAERAGLPPTAVIALHSGADYRVHAIGFAPGFAYLGGLPEKIHAPRRPTPRPKVAAGTVGIGGAQTGVYPLETPGGWNLVGRTPLRMFDAARPEPALLRAGDRVKFRAISPVEFFEIERSRTSGGGRSAGQVTRRAAATSSSVEVVRPGMLSTIQDLGRRGHRARGVPLSGGADAFALRMVNALVGNPENTAALEFTLTGPDLKFSHDTVIALGGAKFGKFPLWQPMKAPAGATLSLGPARRGCRGYLAIAGGFAVPDVLGSASTYLRAGLGGVEGRALRAGDRLAVAEVKREVVGHWHIDERILPAYSPNAELRVVRGAQAAEYGRALFEAEFRVTPQSDRMGVRLHGPALARSVTTDLTSTTVVPGTVQIPPDGHPIVLMADAQTIGGYPQAAHVITVDLPLLAQLRPGDAVRFREVTLAEAHRLASARERTLAMLREGLAQKIH
jgi:KipI family sensor histidine kinase inhibitor